MISSLGRGALEGFQRRITLTRAEHTYSAVFGGPFVALTSLSGVCCGELRCLRWAELVVEGGCCPTSDRPA